MADFYVTVFSNSSEKEYPENSSSKFTIKLPRPINLPDGGWSCGVTEIFHPPIVSTVAPGLSDQDEIIFPKTHSENSFTFDLKTFIIYILENSTRPQLYSERYFHHFLKLDNLKEFDVNSEINAYRVLTPTTPSVFRITPFNIAPQYRVSMEEKDYIIFEWYKKYTMREILWVILKNYYDIYMGGKEERNKLPVEKRKTLGEILLLYARTFVNSVKSALSIKYPATPSNFLLLYTDIIEASITGDTISKLFFITARKQDVEKDVISISNVRYFNVSKTFIETVTFFLSDEAGNQIYFEHGFTPTVLVLHFKKN